MSALQRFKQENKALTEKIAKLEEENRKLQEIAKLHAKIETIRLRAFEQNRKLYPAESGDIVGYTSIISRILMEMGYLKDYLTSENS